MPNTMDNSDTPAAETGKRRLDRRVSSKRRVVESSPCSVADEALTQLLNLTLELLVGCSVSIGSHSNYHVEGGQNRKQRQSHKLPKASLQPISADRALPVFGNDNPNPRTTKKGSDKSNLKI
jgi:hypothetical protein